MLIGYVGSGLVLTWFLLPELKQIRASLILFVVAIGLIGVAAVQDALDLPFMHNRSFRHFQTVAEELAEAMQRLLVETSLAAELGNRVRTGSDGLSLDGCQLLASARSSIYWPRVIATRKSPRN